MIILLYDLALLGRSHFFFNFFVYAFILVCLIRLFWLIFFFLFLESRGKGISEFVQTFSHLNFLRILNFDAVGNLYNWFVIK